MGREFNDRLLLISGNWKLRNFLETKALPYTPWKLAAIPISETNLIKKIDDFNPDLVIFHVDEDPGLLLALLTRIVLTHPVPVLMLTSNTETMKGLIIKCLEIGAVDVITIPADFESVSREHLKRLLRLMESARLVLVRRNTAVRVIDSLGDRKPDDEMLRISHEAAIADIAREGRNYDAIGIAVSTGGPQTLGSFLPGLPENIPVPIFVVQHIIKGFISTLAVRLNKTCSMKVKSAEDGEAPEPGVVYLAPDGLHMRVARNNPEGQARIVLTIEPEDSLFRPSADVLFESMAESYGARCIAIMMTGMGRDGVAGLQFIKDKGGLTLAQDSDSSVIFGMAQVAIEKNLIDRVLPLSELSGAILRAVLTDGEVYSSNEIVTS